MNSIRRFPTTKRLINFRRSAAIKEDMLRPRPMDRLLCGDVGFGKTEVAMRARVQSGRSRLSSWRAGADNYSCRATWAQLPRTHGRLSISNRCAEPLQHSQRARANHTIALN